jgi:Putative peptidoglycan binding domain
MKVIFILFFCCWALNGAAQSSPINHYLIKVEDLDKSVRYDTLSGQMVGRRFVYCVIPDQFETVETGIFDTLAYTQKRVLSYEFTLPQYDSLEVSIGIHPAYSFYEVDKKAKLPKGAILIPPTWEIEIGKVLIDSTQFKVSRFKGLEMGANDSECVGFVVIELPKCYLRTSQRRLKTAALLIQKTDGRTVVDTLKLPSPYLKETKVSAYNLEKKTYSISEPMKITLKSSSPMIPNKIAGKHLLKEGGLSELREYIVCGRIHEPTTIRALQKSLRQRGYWVRINNTMDNRTRRALRMFQRRHHFRVGNLDYRTLNALNVERFMKNEEWTGGNTIDYTIKTVAFDNLESFDDLIFLEALTDEKIANWVNIDVKTIKARRKALKIKEVKRQVIPFEK